MSNVALPWYPPMPEFPTPPKGRWWFPTWKRVAFTVTPPEDAFWITRSYVAFEVEKRYKLKGLGQELMYLMHSSTESTSRTMRNGPNISSSITGESASSNNTVGRREGGGVEISCMRVVTPASCWDVRRRGGVRRRGEERRWRGGDLLHEGGNTSLMLGCEEERRCERRGGRKEGRRGEEKRRSTRA